MKTRRFGAMAGAAIMMALGSAAAAPPNSYRSNGDIVRADSEDPVTGSIQGFQVTTNKDTNGPLSTYFSVYNNVCDDTGCTGLMMSGPIPNEDFSSTPNHAELRTMVVRTDAFEVSAWRYDFATETNTELAPPSGLVAISWEKSGDVFETLNGIFVQTDENYTFRSHGYWESHSATATGTFFGEAVPSRGIIGRSRSMAISISRNRP